MPRPCLDRLKNRVAEADTLEMSPLSFGLLARRIRRAEGGFTLIEVVMAMGIILTSLVVLATAALVGFNGAATARQRQAATAIADQLVEQVRALPFSTVSQGMRDSDLSSDSNIVTCSGTYKYKSCSGETIVHASGASTPPLYPHTATLGQPAYPDTFNRYVYVTYADSNTSVYRIAVQVSWTSNGSTSSVQTQTLLTSPKSSGDSSTQVTSGSSSASYYGTGSASAGSVIVSPNGSVYNGYGITGLTSPGVWNAGDSVTQRMYSLDANVNQGQVSKIDGQSTMTAVQKSLSGTVTTSGGSSTYSTADDDATTSSIGTSSAPTGITQTGPSVSLTGGGNSLTMNQYTQTTTTTTTAGTIAKRSASSATSDTGSITVPAPSGMATGDLLLVGLSYQGACMSTPSGWTVIRNCDTNTVSSSIFYRFATASDVSAGSFSFTTGGTSATVAGIVAYTGADTSGPIDKSAGQTGSSATATGPTLTSTTSNARLVGFFAAVGNTTVTPTDPGSGNPGATNWAQNWSDKDGLSSTYYLTSTPALSTTAGSGTLSSGGTTSSTFTTAKTFATTVNTSIPNGAHDWSFQASISTASIAAEYEYRFYLARQNSSGTTLSQSGYSTTFTGTGTKTYTFTGWDPGTWATGDKLAVVWEHRKVSGSGQKSATMDTTSSSFVTPSGTTPWWVGGASASGDKKPAGAGVDAPGWSATLSQSTPWVAQMVSLKPNIISTTTTTTGSPGSESGSTVSTTAAAASPSCGSPAQTDGKACAYSTQSYAVPSGADNAFLSTTADLSGSGAGTCKLFNFMPPNNSATNYAYGRRSNVSGNERVSESVTRSYGTATFGSMCSGTGTTPSQWPGYFVKFDAGTSASQVSADAGAIANPTASASTAGTIYVWNGSGTTSFAVPTNGTWSTSPTTVNYTTNSGYVYNISSTLGSGQTYCTGSSVGCTSSTTEAKAVVGSPVIGTISYKVTDASSHVLIDVTMTIDLGSLVSYAKYTSAA